MNIGCDIEKISRFKGKTREKDEKFLNRLFTPSELEYCFSKAKPEESLCARFCAKEAYIKAKGTQNVPFNEIEILAKEFNFSGGDINIALRNIKKQKIINNKMPSFNEIYNICKTIKIIS